METIVQDILNIFGANIETLALTLATALGAGLVLALKLMFALAARLAKRTSTALDDKLIDDTRRAFKDKSRDL